MTYYINTVETIRVDTVQEALALRAEMSEAQEYIIESFSYVEKYDKKTDEEYVIVKVKKIINKEKEPISGIRVIYECN